MAGRFNFPQWNYGYPLGPPGNLAPPGYTGPGDYAQFYNYYGQSGSHASAPPRGSGPPHPPPHPNQKATAVKSEPPNTPPTALASAMMKAAQVLQPNSVKPEPGIIEAMLGMTRPQNKGGRPPKNQNHWNHAQPQQQPVTDMEIRKEQGPRLI